MATAPRSPGKETTEEGEQLLDVDVLGQKPVHAAFQRNFPIQLVVLRQQDVPAAEIRVAARDGAVIGLRPTLTQSRQQGLPQVGHENGLGAERIVSLRRYGE